MRLFSFFPASAEALPGTDQGSSIQQGKPLLTPRKPPAARFDTFRGLGASGTASAEAGKLARVPGQIRRRPQTPPAKLRRRPQTSPVKFAGVRRRLRPNSPGPAGPPGRDFIPSNPYLYEREKQTPAGVPAQTLRRAPNLLEGALRRRPHGRHHRRHRGPTAGHRLRYRLRSQPGERTHHSHHRRLHRLHAWRQLGADRRAHGRLHCHRLRHHPKLRHRRPHHRHAAGRRPTAAHGPDAPRDGHQVHPLPHHRRLHKRHRPDHLHHADQGPARADDRSHAGRLPLQMGGVRRKHHDHLVAGRRGGPREHRPDRAYAARLEACAGFAGGHRGDDHRGLHPARTLRPDGPRDHRRPLPDQRLPTHADAHRHQSGDDQSAPALGLHHRHARRHRVAALGHSGRRCDGRQARLEHGADGSGRGQHHRAPFRRHPRHRRHRPHDDEHQ